jgi:hypothetical protein
VKNVLPALALLLATNVTPAPAATKSVLSVRPGSIVRWPGEGVLECRQGERRSAPIAGVCYFPIDLLATGTIEVERRTVSGVEKHRLSVASYPYPTESLTGVEEKYVSPPAAELARIEHGPPNRVGPWKDPRVP